MITFSSYVEQQQQQKTTTTSPPPTTVKQHSFETRNLNQTKNGKTYFSHFGQVVFYAFDLNVTLCIEPHYNIQGIYKRTET